MNVVVSLDRLDPVPSNGLQRVAIETARRLARGGDRVTLLTLLRPGERAEDDVAGVRILRYAGGGGAAGAALSAGAALRKLHAERAVDVLHAHFAYSALGPLVAGAKSIARVRTYHGAWDLEAIAERPFLWTDTLRYGAEWIGLRAFDRTIVLSDYARAQIVARYGVDDDRIDRIPGGANLERFAPGRSRSACRGTFGVSSEAFVIACAGRLVKRKGFDRLIAALPEIAASIPTALLLVAGAGPEHARLEATIARLGYGARVRLLGALDDTLPDLYRAADLVVVPSTAYETFGLVTVEALACGTPVVGSPTGATPEILRALDPSLVARRNTSAGLAEAVIGFARPASRAQLGPERVRAFATRYSWDEHARGVRATLERAICERARRLGRERGDSYA